MLLEKKLDFAGLRKLQEDIEKVTMSYQEESFYHNRADEAVH